MEVSPSARLLFVLLLSLEGKNILVLSYFQNLAKQDFFQPAHKVTMNRNSCSPRVTTGHPQALPSPSLDYDSTNDPGGFDPEELTKLLR